MEKVNLQDIENDFIAFLKEQGIYEETKKALFSFERCSISTFCKRHHPLLYVKKLEVFNYLTDNSIVITAKWERFLSKKYDLVYKVVYYFLVKNGVLFHFINNSSKNLREICYSKPLFGILLFIGGECDCSQVALDYYDNIPKHVL